MSNKVFFNLDDLFISVGIDIGADSSENLTKSYITVLIPLQPLFLK